MNSEEAITKFCKDNDIELYPWQRNLVRLALLGKSGGTTVVGARRAGRATALRVAEGSAALMNTTIDKIAAS